MHAAAECSLCLHNHIAKHDVKWCRYKSPVASTSAFPPLPCAFLRRSFSLQVEPSQDGSLKWFPANAECDVAAIASWKRVWCTICLRLGSKVLHGCWSLGDRKTDGSWLCKQSHNRWPLAAGGVIISKCLSIVGHCVRSLRAQVFSRFDSTSEGQTCCQNTPRQWDDLDNNIAANPWLHGDN